MKDAKEALPEGLADILDGTSLAMFDFDGTLAYTQGRNLSVYETVFAELGVTGITEEEYVARIDHPIEDHVRHIAECHGMPLTGVEVARASRRFMEIADAYNAEHLPSMYRYVPVALSRLSGTTCFVVTANKRDHVDRVLGAWGIRDRFAGIVMTDGTDGFRDKREAYEAMLGTLAEKSEGICAVVFEDSGQAISFAKGLGMVTVGIVHPRSGPHSADQADFRIDVTGECHGEA